MRPAIIWFLLAFATAGVAQNYGVAHMEGLQTPGTVDPKTPAMPEELMNGSLRCPLQMNVQRQGSAGARWLVSIEDAKRTSELPQLRSTGIGIRVEVRSPKNKALGSVKLALYFTPAVAGVMPVSGDASSRNSNQMLRKTFELSANNGGAPLLSADLLAGTTVILSHVRPLRVSYADGTAWHEMKGYPCNVPIDHLMRIETR